MRTLALFLLALPATALAVPMELAHQGRLFDAIGGPLNAPDDLTFRLYDAPSGGTPVWEEALTAVPFTDGYFAVTLGAGSTTLDSSVFDDDDLWMSIAVGSGPELGDRLKIASVPFAIRAQTATSVSGGIVDASEIRVNGTTVIDGSGSVSAPVDWSSITSKPAGIDDGTDDDTLGSLTSCSSGQVAVWDGSSWGCGTVGGSTIDASGIVSGTVDIARLPVGDDDTSVAAGDHTHPFAEVTGIATAAQIPDLDAGKLTSGQVALGRLPVGTGSTQIAAGDHGHTAAEVGAIPAGGLVQIGASTATCSSSIEGALRWESGAIELCDGSEWTPMVLENTADGSTQARASQTCNTLHASHPAQPSGTYWIDPNGGVTSDAFEAYCDMTTSGGGWTRVVGIASGNTSHRNTGAVNAAGMTTSSANGKFSDSVINSMITDRFRFTCNGVTTYFNGVLDADSPNQTNGCTNSASGSFYATGGYPSHYGLDSWSPSGGSCNYIIYNYTGNGCWQGANGRSGVVWVR